jgi:uncharacterized protein YciI
MFFIFVGRDKPDSLALRMVTKASHSRFLDTCQEVLMTGPILDAAGAECGSVMVFRAESIAALNERLVDEPYRRAGLFAQTEILPWVWKRGNPYL